MTPEQREILRTHESRLVRDIIPSDLLCLLVCLTEDDREVIIADERNYGPIKAAGTLLDRLKRRGNSAFGEFVRALRENLLGHLALLLDPRFEATMVVHREGWDKIHRTVRYIVKEIDPRRLLPILERGEVLTQADCERIAAACANYGESSATEHELLNRLKRHGPLAFTKFIAALREAGFSHTAQLLDPGFEVTDRISEGRRDDRVFQAGVAADLRVKICFKEAAEEQIKRMKTFCERYHLSYTEDAIELRDHFKDFVDEHVQRFVNLVKTTCSEDTPLIFVFRLSNVDAARSFRADFDDGNLQSVIRRKLRSFSNEHNCFKNEEIDYDLVVDPDDYNKVLSTLENPAEQKLLVDGMEKRQLSLRDYQVELVQPALEGKNTIICAPTGSGKTFVAMEVIKHRVANETEKYVAFIVNTVSLVEQQKSCLDRFLPESVEISNLCGNNPDISLPEALENTQVVVLTAQILLNALTKEKEGSKEKEISLTQFSLLVFDECHHTIKGHPYNEIMRWYMKEKFSDSATASSLPQILGLSASLGIGTGNTGCVTQATEYILGLCANLDIHQLQVYTKPQVTCTKITSVSSDRNNVFHMTVSDIMSKIEETMSSSCTHSHGTQSYENWVVSLRKEDMGRDYLTCAEQLNFYNTSLMINDEIRAQDALQYLQENIKSSESTPLEKKLGDIFDEAVLAVQGMGLHQPNPGLQKLEQLLLDKWFGGVQSKGIIFVRTRYVAERLVKWLKNCESLAYLVKNPTWLIGSGQRNGIGGMAKARQDHEIKNFRDGDCNIIVATSALLEGIDIPKCNFVINYGMPGNEIMHVQARGRVRTNERGDDYTYDLIVPCEQLTTKERDLCKEKLMNEAVSKVKRMSKENFEKQVKRLQSTAYREYLKELAKQGSSRVQAVPDDVNLHCVKCDQFACKAKDIRRINTAYVVLHHEVNLQNAYFNTKNSGKFLPGDLNETGRTCCQKCDQDWGSRAKNEHGEFPLLKISSFRVRCGVRSKVYPKWKNFPYVPLEFNAETDNIL